MFRNLKVKGKIAKRIIVHTLRGLTGPGHLPGLVNIIFPTEINFPIRSRYTFLLMFFLTFKSFGMFVS